MLEIIFTILGIIGMIALLFCTILIIYMEISNSDMPDSLVGLFLICLLVGLLLCLSNSIYSLVENIIYFVR